MEISQARLLEDAEKNPSASARLLGTFYRKSGGWLNALPVSSLENLLDNRSVSIAVSLRLGISCWIFA